MVSIVYTDSYFAAARGIPSTCIRLTAAAPRIRRADIPPSAVHRMCRLGAVGKRSAIPLLYRSVSAIGDTVERRGA